MKTTDLIPLILYQLVDGDKYGYEIVKQIEDASSGNIIIKQPTLYSVLKKLEHGKFISSYWQDSEIGGKRHYYKLTENGKSQLDTYPSFEQLVSDIVNGDEEIDISASKPIEPSSPIAEQEEDLGVADDDETKVDYIDISLPSNNQYEETESHTTIEQEADQTLIKPIHIDIASSIEPIQLSTTNYEDKQDSLFQTTEGKDKIEVNEIEISASLRPDSNDIVATPPTTINIFDAIEPANYDEGFKLKVDNAKDVSTTTNANVETTGVATPTVSVQNSNKLYEKLTPNEELFNISPNLEDEQNNQYIEPIEQIKYLNYVDFSTDESSIKRKKSIRKHIQKMCLTWVSLLMVLILGMVLGNKYSFSKVSYICAIVACAVLVLYPIILLKNKAKLRLKYCSNPFKYSISKDFFIKLSLFLSVIIVIFAYNLSLLNDIQAIFKLTNFSNFLAPIMFSVVVMLDFVYSVILYKDYRK
ncbi:MAG: helix-turn-helix transcriptional regulator [Clostridia bacterium]|nr:helix-turn-helix transcriptional regulator [Clostridia bacterium]